MNRTVFTLPERIDYVTRGGLAVQRVVEHFSGGANRLDALIELAGLLLDNTLKVLDARVRSVAAFAAALIA